jgi:hypothetical protein
VQGLGVCWRGYGGLGWPQGAAADKKGGWQPRRASRPCKEVRASRGVVAARTHPSSGRLLEEGAQARLVSGPRGAAERATGSDRAAMPAEGKNRGGSGARRKKRRGKAWH